MLQLCVVPYTYVVLTIHMYILHVRSHYEPYTTRTHAHLRAVIYIHIAIRDGGRCAAQVIYSTARKFEPTLG